MRRFIDPSLSFRQKILRGKFFELQLKDTVWVHIRPEFQTMYPLSQRFLEGTVVYIGDQTVRVHTEIGEWFFEETGLSRTGQATLSVRSSRFGELLCLYEPEPVTVP